MQEVLERDDQEIAVGVAGHQCVVQRGVDLFLPQEPHRLPDGIVEIRGR